MRVTAPSNLSFSQRLFGHLRTVHQHRAMVRKLCFQCGLYWQGITHDLSKYHPIEFINGIKFYTGTASPHIGERKAYGYSKAWLHHQAKNKHHAEYWWDHRDDKSYGPVDMPDSYLIELICDRVAASKTYLGNKYTDRSPLDYYVSHGDAPLFNESTRTKLEHHLTLIAEKGFIAFKDEIKKSKKES